MTLNVTATIVFVALFLFVTWIGFIAARWRKADLDQLHEWGLGGRRFGTIVTWFLLGGDLWQIGRTAFLTFFIEKLDSNAMLANLLFVFKEKVFAIK